MRGVVGTVILIAICSGTTAVAQTSSVPRYDVKQQCNKVASFGGTYSEMVMDGCLGMEQTAYDQLKQAWNTLPESIRTNCDKIAKFGGVGSYMTLQGCVEMETGAAKKNAESVFKY